MSQFAIFKTSLRFHALPLRCRCGVRFYASNIKKVTQLQDRSVSEENPSSSDSRQKYFEDLIGTIEQLHKAKLSEQPFKIPKTELNTNASGLISHNHPLSQRQICHDPVASQATWTSSVDSFYKQLLQFRPDTLVKEKPKSLTSKKVVTNNEFLPKASLKQKDIKNSKKSYVTTHNSHTNSRVNSKQNDITDVATQDNSYVGDEMRKLSSNEFSFDVGMNPSLDITKDQDRTLLSVMDEGSAFEDIVETSDFDYHFADNQTVPKQDRTEIKTTKKKAKDSIQNKKAKESGVMETSKSLRQPLWTEKDLEQTEQLKVVMERVAGLLRGNKRLMMEQAMELEKKAKEATYLEEISSYVDLCINTNMLKTAQLLLTVAYLKGKHKTVLKGLRPVHDIAIYNKLMRAWAKQGNLEAIKKLFIQFEGRDLKPTCESYAVCLECLGRQDVLSSEVIANVLEDIKKAGHGLQNIFTECNLVEEEKFFILKAIHKVIPDFKPNMKLPATDYTCPLLLDLNANKEFVTNPFHGVLSKEQIMKKAEEQIKIETTDTIVVDSVLPTPNLTAPVLAARQRLANEKEKWRSALKQSFIMSKQHMESNNIKAVGTSLLPYLKLWNANAYVDLMMQEVEMLGQDMAIYSPTCTYLHYNLGNKIFRKFIAQTRIRSRYTDKVLSLYDEYGKRFNEDKLSKNHRQIWTDVTSSLKLENFMLFDSEQWPAAVTKALGKFLYDVIMSEVKVEVPSKKVSEESDNTTDVRVNTNIPAFFTVYRMRNGSTTEEVLPHPFLVRLYSEAHLTQLTFEPSGMPSLVPPIPWSAYNCGGNILNTTDIIRNSRLSTKHCQILKSLPSQSLFPMFDGLNAVSACPWMINKRVLDTVVEVFNKGGDTKIGIPERVDMMAELPKITPKMTADQRLSVLRKNQVAIKERKEMYSQWCTELYRLSIAQKYRNEVFWFPHNMDFRGRIYPTPPHFNHLGSDVARSILVFAKGKPLGPGGLDWLKIHLINLTGLKKRQPNRDRLAYANEILPEILDSADNPLTGRMWWQKSDEPWQTLACCVEIANAVRSPDAEKFVSHIPVHQDGSCNGLQHYAALGRDESGASSVNLNSFDSPQDVYSDAVDLVEKRRQVDAANGVEIAKQIEGFIQRKVIKQTIMTTVYGVTKYGARNQIGGHLRHIDEFPKELVFPAMLYLTDKTFESLQEMFTSTKEIQDWFVLCAEIVSQLRHQPVEWVTPLGWPILQPYFRTNKLSDKTIGSVNYEKPNTNKQKNAFPPNFIHSLDSAHMMLTAIHCLRNGILFASVHDCFWTHACDIPQMNKICREQFVRLHSEPILEDLAKYLVEKFGFPENSSSDKEILKQAKQFVNHILKKVPERGTFDIKKVLDSTYFFS